jgi:hypothetical protein
MVALAQRWRSFDLCFPVRFDCVAFLLPLDVVILFLTLSLSSRFSDMWGHKITGPVVVTARASRRCRKTPASFGYV